MGGLATFRAGAEADMPSHDDSRLATQRAIASRGAEEMADRSAQAEPKWVYAFAAGYVDGRASMTELLGGKGANLAEMASLGLPVPPGFTITTKVCDAYYALGRKLPDGL
jgi:pyruvate,orthophosphate dikinase